MHSFQLTQYYINIRSNDTIHRNEYIIELNENYLPATKFVYLLQIDILYILFNTCQYHTMTIIYLTVFQWTSILVLCISFLEMVMGHLNKVDIRIYLDYSVRSPIIQTANFNDDDYMDFVWADYLLPGFIIYFGNANGSYTKELIDFCSNAGYVHNGLLLADFNNDNVTDVALLYPTNRTIIVFFICKWFI